MYILKSLIYILLLLPILGYSQTSGVIYYTSVMKMDRELPDHIPEDIRKTIPKERKVNKELYFDKTASVFKNGEQVQTEDGEFDGEGRGRRFRRRMMGGGADEQTYTDLSSKAAVKTRDIMGKTFLIEDEPTSYKWKMTGQKKQIFDYLAMEATTSINDSVQVNAWFTPQIPVSIGPGDLGGLPGAILEASYNDRASRTITATKIELKDLDKSEIKKPSKGKKVTQEEFNEIRKEKMKEMRGQRGGRGGFRGRRGGGL